MPTTNHDAAFIRRIGHLVLWGLGVFPLAVLLMWGVELISAYLSVVCVGVGIAHVNHANRLKSTKKEIHDQ